LIFRYKVGLAAAHSSAVVAHTHAGERMPRPTAPGGCGLRVAFVGSRISRKPARPNVVTITAQVTVVSVAEPVGHVWDQHARLQQVGIHHLDLTR